MNPDTAQLECTSGGLLTAPDMRACLATAAALSEAGHHLSRNLSSGHLFDSCLAPSTQTTTATTTAGHDGFSADFRCSPSPSTPTRPSLSVPPEACPGHARVLNQLVSQCDERPGRFRCRNSTLHHPSIHECSADMYVLNMVLKDFSTRTAANDDDHQLSCLQTAAEVRMVSNGQASCSDTIALLNFAAEHFVAGRYTQCGDGFTTLTTTATSSATSSEPLTQTSTATSTQTSTATSTPATLPHCNGAYDKHECHPLTPSDCLRDFVAAGFDIRHRCPVLCGSCTTSTTTTTTAQCNGRPDPADCGTIYKARCNQEVFGVDVRAFCPGTCNMCTTTTTTATLSSLHNMSLVFVPTAGAPPVSFGLAMFRIKMASALAAKPVELVENEHYRIENMEEAGGGVVGVQLWFASEEAQDMLALFTIAQAVKVSLGTYEYVATVQDLTTSTTTSKSTSSSTPSPFLSCSLVQDTAELFAVVPSRCRSVVAGLNSAARLCSQALPRVSCTAVNNVARAADGTSNSSTANTLDTGLVDFGFGPNEETPVMFLLAGDATRCQNVADALNAAFQSLRTRSQLTLAAPHVTCSSGFLGVAVGCRDATEAILASLENLPASLPLCQYHIEQTAATGLFYFAKTLAFDQVVANLDYAGFVLKLEVELIAFLGSDRSQIHVEAFDRTTGAVTVRITPGFLVDAEPVRALFDRLEQHVNDPGDPFVMKYLGVWLSTSTDPVGSATQATAATSEEQSLVPLLSIPVFVLSLCFVMVCWMQCKRSRHARTERRAMRVRAKEARKLAVALADADAKRRAEVEEHTKAKHQSPVMDAMEIVPLADLLGTPVSAFGFSPAAISHEDSEAAWSPQPSPSRALPVHSFGFNSSVVLPYGPAQRPNFGGGGPGVHDAATSPMRLLTATSGAFDSGPGRRLGGATARPGPTFSQPLFGLDQEPPVVGLDLRVINPGPMFPVGDFDDSAAFHDPTAALSGAEVGFSTGPAPDDGALAANDVLDVSRASYQHTSAFSALAGG